MQFQIDHSHRGTLATMLLAFLGAFDIDAASQIVFMCATIVTATLTSIYTIKKIKQLNNEKNTNES